MAAATGVNNTEAMVQDTLRLIEAGLKEFDQVNGPVMKGMSVIVIGGTGVGKSTLINLLAGVKLKATYDPRRDKVKIDADDESLPNFKIGHGVKSETSIPRKCLIEGVMFWDCPGLEDNRSKAQEIANAVCIKEVFRASGQVKILLMIDDASIQGSRSNPLMNFVTAVDRLFLEEVKRLKKSVSLIVSQAPSHRKVEHYQAYIDDVLKSEGLEGPRRSILESLKTRISIFKEPERGSYSLDTTDVRAAIMHEISKIEYARGVVANTCISARCYATINDSYNELYTHIKELATQFNHQFYQCIDTFVTPVSDQNLSLDASQRQDMKQRLKAIIQKLNTVIEQEYPIQKIPKMIRICQEVATACGRSLKDNLITIKGKIETMRVLEQYVTEKMRCPLDIVSSIRQILAESRTKIEKAIINIAAKDAEEIAEQNRQRAEREKQRANQERQRHIKANQRIAQQLKPVTCRKCGRHHKPCR